MKRTLVINVAGLSARLVSEMPALARPIWRGPCLPLEPVLPATTCPMQATLTTGEPPARHGIVANGLYFHDTAEVRFWEQSARLVGAPRVWSLGRGKQPKVAMLFWQQSLYDPTVDVLLTPKPVHGPGGELIQDCYSRPADLYDRLVEGESALEPGKLRGAFNLMHYWGPMAGIGSSRWIADAALAVWRDEEPDLALVYLPHLDYSGHRSGPCSEAHRAAARELDSCLAALLEAADEVGARTIVLSEYSFVPVRRAVAPNRALREAGYLAVREVAGGEYLHPGDLRAFAMVDNQVAHVYFPATENLKRDVQAVGKLLAGLDGVAEVLDRAAMAERGLDHVRSGELVALAEPDAHFVYYWWLDDAKAPPFARTVDIHSKPGFDPAELLIDADRKGIPLSADGIRGSHGLVGEGDAGWGVFLASDAPKSLAGRASLRATEVAHLLLPDAVR
ncbi:MAG: nucleotide pyrophosphatase/phosphodiesterase family protein [Phycisphaerae bacterium]